MVEKISSTRIVQKLYYQQFLFSYIYFVIIFVNTHYIFPLLINNFICILSYILPNSVNINTLKSFKLIIYFIKETLILKMLRNTDYSEKIFYLNYHVQTYTYLKYSTNMECQMSEFSLIFKDCQKFMEFNYYQMHRNKIIV